MSYYYNKIEFINTFIEILKSPIKYDVLFIDNQEYTTKYRFKISNICRHIYTEKPTQIINDLCEYFSSITILDITGNVSLVNIPSQIKEIRIDNSKHIGNIDLPYVKTLNINCCDNIGEINTPRLKYLKYTHLSSRTKQVEFTLNKFKLQPNLQYIHTYLDSLYPIFDNIFSLDSDNLDYRYTNMNCLVKSASKR
jgi:hypothetical protein